MRRLHLLLIVWCLLVAGPGILSALGIFGHFGPTTTFGGAIVGLWIGGYLAQFAVFMWISRIVKKQRVLWWLGASLLPWAFDWFLPVYPVQASPLFLLLIGIAVWVAVLNGRETELEEHGIRATGVVIEVLKPWMNVVINNVYIRRKVRLRVERHDGVAPYEALYKSLYMIGNVPSPGDRLPLLVDPKNPRHFDRDEEGSTAQADSGRPRTRASSEKPAFVKELADLSAMHRRGELTDEEFDAAKRKLLR